MDSLPWNNKAFAALAVPKRTAESFTVPETREALLFSAKICEQTARYDEMLLCVRQLVKIQEELTPNERNVLSAAYKNVIGARRNACRVLIAAQATETEAESRINAMMRKQCEFELAKVCEDLLRLLDNHLIPAAASGEPKVFYLKLKGDYHRYYAEVDTGDTQKRAALETYQKAMAIAKEALAPTHSIRLGLALNLSVFYYEIMKKRQEGVDLAQHAYDDAVAELDELEQEDYSEASLVVGLLRDNLNLWQEARM